MIETLKPDRRARFGLVGLIALVSLLLTPPAGAKSLPAKPMTLVVGSATGGSNDIFARALGRRLQEVLGQPVVVDNRPAGGGILANAHVAKATADGTTLVVLSSTFTTGAAIRTNLQYDAIKSFTPIAMLAKGPLLITVPNSSPYKTLQELVQAARANPGKLNYGTSGAGSINHFATELWAAAAGVQLTHVPYKGMSPATNDLIGGQIDLLVASAPSILAQVKSGRVRALAVTTSVRSPVAPELVAVDEAGYRGSATELWWGVLAPAGTPPAIVERLNAEINKIITSTEMKEFFLVQGAEPAAMRAAEFKAFIESEIERWKRVAKASDIQAD